jgi:hypothetical protein
MEDTAWASRAWVSGGLARRLGQQRHRARVAGDAEELDHRMGVRRWRVAQPLDQALGVLQLLLELLQLVGTGLAQVLHQFGLQLPQVGDALAGHLEPAPAELGVQRGTGPGGAQRAAQALQLSHRGGELQLLPARAGPGRRTPRTPPGCAPGPRSGG